MKGQSPFHAINDASKQLAMVLMDTGWLVPLDGVLPWPEASHGLAHLSHATPMEVAHLMVKYSWPSYSGMKMPVDCWHFLQASVQR